MILQVLITKILLRIKENATLPSSVQHYQQVFKSYKMTVTDQLKITGNKIKANQAQYDLDRLVAKKSALSSNASTKYEYLTVEGLGYKPSVVEQARFDYSPLGKMFNKGLAEEHKNEGLLKGVKNIEDKNQELLKVFSAANKISKAAKNESDFN